MKCSIRSHRAAAIAATLVLSGAFGDVATGQEKWVGGGRGGAVRSEPSDPTAPSATFVVKALGTSRTGATPSGSASGIRRLTIGKTALFGVSEMDFEVLGSSGWPIQEWVPTVLEERPDRSRQYARQHAWRVEVKLLSVQIDEVQCELNWGRYDRGRSLTEPVAGNVSTLRLRQGQRHTVDLMHASSPSSSLENIVIELELDAVTDPAHGDLSFACDLWLVHEDAAGRKTTRRVDVRAGQGKEEAFAFQPIGFTLDGAVEPVQESRADLTDLAQRLGKERGEPGSPADYQAALLTLQDVQKRLAALAGRPTPPTVDLSVSGTVKARLRHDGSIDIDLRAERRMRCLGGGAFFGRLKGPLPVTVKSGETVAFQFPTYGASCGMPSGTSMPGIVRQGVELRDGIVWVNSTGFLGDQKTSLLLTVTRQR